VAEQGWEAFTERVDRTGTEEAGSRIVNLMLGPVLGAERAGLFGYGVGTAHQASPRFASSASHTWLPEGYVENGIVRLITELGILGWLVLLSLKSALLYLAYQTIRNSRRPLELIVGATAFCVLLSNLALPVVFNVVKGAFYWGAAGAMLGVWSVQRMRQEVHEAQARSAPEVPA